MNYFVSNTDRKSLLASPHDVWFEASLAITGGDPRYGRALGRLAARDIVFMYANRMGVVGVGRVRRPWDGESHDPPLVYVNPKLSEYHLPVEWFLDLRTDPIPPTELELLGFHPIPRAVIQLREGVGKKVLHHARRGFLEAQSRLHSGATELQLLQSESESGVFIEGRKIQVTSNRYERDPHAREVCIYHYGTRCSSCDFSFGEIYGPPAEGYIHIHHLVPLSTVGPDYVVDPIRDLRPLCPNCHAAVHMGVHIALQ